MGPKDQDQQRRPWLITIIIQHTVINNDKCKVVVHSIIQQMQGPKVQDIKSEEKRAEPCMK